MVINGVSSTRDLTLTTEATTFDNLCSRGENTDFWNMTPYDLVELPMHVIILQWMKNKEGESRNPLSV
jgi:hypothetical protein